MFTVASPKNSTARRLATPLPPSHVREKSTLPKHSTARPLSPPKKPPIVEWGGGDRGCSPWRRPRTPLQVAYPPKKPTIRVMGGGTKGCSMWRHSNTAVNVAYPPLPHVAYPPLPPPPLMSWKIKIKNETYLFGGIPKAADDALKQG